MHGVMQSAEGHNQANELPFFSSFFSNTDNCSESHVQTFPPHTQIARQGDNAEMLYIIERGSVKLTRLAPNGRELIVGIRRRSYLVGTTAVLLGRTYSFTTTTLVRSSLRCIPAKAFLNLASTNNLLSWHLNIFLSQEIVRQRDRLAANSCMAAKDSLKCFLRELVREQQEDEPYASSELRVPLNNQELAEIIAVTPEHLCRLLKKIEQDGIIRRNKGVLIVSDVAALVNKAED